MRAIFDGVELYLLTYARFISDNIIFLIGTQITGYGNDEKTDCEPCDAGKYCPEPPASAQYRKIDCTAGMSLSYALFLARALTYMCSSLHVL